MAEALYRKYRPQVFEDMVGQEHIERTLKNAIDQDKVSHAYLFCGPRGTGKTTTARLLAKALLCKNGPTSSPDGTCRDCEEVAEGTHPDVYELDAASRTGVENVREEIIGRVNFAPTRGKKKIYIIDEVHMLSTAAFNALLKTLEEPPAHVVFVLCTTDPQKVPATIHSRCQRFDFHRLGTDEIVSRLGAVCMGEDVEFEGDALAIVAHRADGGMRNALTSLEQLIAFGNGTVTVQGAEDLLGSLDSSDMAEIVRAVGRRDVAACFNWTANYVESGADLAQFARDLAQRIRNMYVMSLAGADVALEIPDAERREIAEELLLFGPDRLARVLALLGDLISELRTAGNPRLCFEIALTRMVRPDSDLTLESLAERVEALEEGKSAVAMYVPESAPASAPQAATTFSHVQSDVGQPASASVASPAAGSSLAPAARDAVASALVSAARPAVRPDETDRAPSSVGTAFAPSNQPSASSRVSAPTSSSQAAASPAAQMRADARFDSFPSSAVSHVDETQMAQGSAQAPSIVPGSQDVQEDHQTAGHVDAALASIVTNPAALQRVWRSVVAAVKKERVSYGVLFVNVRAKAEADGSGVVVEFPADNPFAFAMAQKPDVQDVMSKAFDRVAGVHVPFRCAQTQPEPTQAAPSAAVPISQAPSVPIRNSVPGTTAGVPGATNGVQTASDGSAARAMSSVPVPKAEGNDSTARTVGGVPGVASSSSDASADGVPARADRVSANPPHPAQARSAQVQSTTSRSAPTVGSASGALANHSRSGQNSLTQVQTAPYDEVPLDVYDDMAPSYDDDYGYGDYASASGWRGRQSERMGAPKDAASPSEPEGRSAATSQPAAEANRLVRSMPPSASVPAEAVAPVESAGPAEEPAGNADDLSKMISSSMGVDVFFEEVDE